MDKWTYFILDALFFTPVIILWFILFRKVIFAHWKFILISGALGGLLFFIIDIRAVMLGAWSMNYVKTFGPILGPSVIEELIWMILVFMIVATLIEVYILRKQGFRKNT